MAKKAFDVSSIRNILVLGDSISHNGIYVNLLELAFRRKGRNISLINIGLSGETASGLSEPNHPLCLRPCVYNRAPSAISKIPADTVIVSYGMNDGIFQPLSASLLRAHQAGMERLLRLLEENGKQVIVLTTQYFDSRSAAACGTKLNPDGMAAPYSYMSPYRFYENTVSVFAGWDLSLEEKFPHVKVVNIHTALKSYYREKRIANPGFVEGDGIHPALAGHAVIAGAILQKVWGESLPQDLAETYETSPAAKLTAEKNGLLSCAYRAFCGFHADYIQEKALPLEEAKAKADELEKELSLLSMS